MPSRTYQTGIILSGIDKKTGKKTYILVSKRTGFRDVTINGVRYYYNINENYQRASDLSFEQIIKEHTGNHNQQTIVIRRSN